MWNIIGTAVQGRGHVRKNIPVQDKIISHKGDVNVIVLADGAGSAKLSHLGAEIAVKTTCDLLKDHFDAIYHNDSVSDTQVFIMKQIEVALTKISESHKEPVSAFASTLLAVAVKQNKVLILHLGDGEIGAIKNGKMVSISSSENGEYANSTIFTTSRHATKHLKLFKSQESHLFTAFFLMSDGAANSLFSKQNNIFSPFIKKLTVQAKVIKEEMLENMLKDSFESFVKQKTMDDCSFIMMTAVEDGISYFNLNEKDKEMLFHYLPNTKHCSIKKWDEIIALLKTPMTLKQIVKVSHLKKSYVRRNIIALQSLGYVEIRNQKYQLVETSGD